MSKLGIFIYNLIIYNSPTKLQLYLGVVATICCLNKRQNWRYCSTESNSILSVSNHDQYHLCQLCLGLKPPELWLLHEDKCAWPFPVVRDSVQSWTQQSWCRSRPQLHNKTTKWKVWSWLRSSFDKKDSLARSFHILGTSADNRPRFKSINL